MNIEASEIEKAVVELAVQRLVDEYVGGDLDLSEEISKRAKEIVKQRLDEAVDSQIKKVVDDGLEKILFPCTNAYGEEKKPPQTLREYVGSEVSRVFTEYLDNNGKPTTDSWYRKPECQRVNKIIATAVGDRIQKDIELACHTIQANIAQHLGNYVKDQLNSMVKRLV